MLNSMNKHGWENFKFEIIEFCSNDLTPERELFWIKKFNSTDKNKGYNIRADVSGKMILDSRTSEKISSRLRKEWLSGVRDSHSDKLKFSWMNRDRDEQSRLMRKNLTRYKYEVKNSAIVKTVSYSELGDLKNVIATFHRKKTDTVLFKGYTITRICI